MKILNKVSKFVPFVAISALILQMFVGVMPAMAATASLVNPRLIDDISVVPDYGGQNTGLHPAVTAHVKNLSQILTCKYSYKTGHWDPTLNFGTEVYTTSAVAAGVTSPDASGTGGTCSSPAINPIAGDTLFYGTISVSDSLGTDTQTSLPYNMKNDVAPVVTVGSVVTNNNPTPTITGTIDDPNANITVEIHQGTQDPNTLLYAVDYFGSGTINGGTWTANPTTDFYDGATGNPFDLSTLPDGVYQMDVFADNANIAGTWGLASGTYTVDTVAPTATVSYNPSSVLTNQDVVATITPSETVTGTLTHTFTANGTYTFNFTDLAGNAGSVIATVNSIDKVAPTATVAYSVTTPTNQDVVATITPSKPGTSVLTHTFTSNGTYIFILTDFAGNTGSATASVTWIDKVAPVITQPATVNVEYGNPYIEQGATAVDNSGNFAATPSGTVNTSVLGPYTITYNATDAAGNIAAPVTRTVNVVPRNVTLTANAASKVFGAADPALGYTVASGSLISGDVPTGSLSRVAGESVGVHAITQGTLALNSNYNLTFVGANLTITAVPAPITVSTSPAQTNVGSSSFVADSVVAPTTDIPAVLGVVAPKASGTTATTTKAKTSDAKSTDFFASTIFGVLDWVWLLIAAVALAIGGAWWYMVGQRQN